jgi:hypothetical protein
MHLKVRCLGRSGLLTGLRDHQLVTQAVRKRLVARCRAAWMSAVAIAGIRRIPARCGRLDGSRVRAGRTSNGGTALEKRHSRSQGYVFIAAISGPSPKMLVTRVRL